MVKFAVQTANKAIGLKPDLAAAYFVRGWARNLEKPGSDAALADVKKSAELAPSDPLFLEAVRYLSGLR